MFLQKARLSKIGELIDMLCLKLFKNAKHKISPNLHHFNGNFGVLTHCLQKDLTKNASGQITDHYDLP